MDETTETTATTEAATAEVTDYKLLWEQAQAEADKWKAMSRKNEGKAKANADAADQLADLSQRLAAIEGENAALKEQAERAALVARVAKATGLDASIVGALNGADEETLTRQATAIASLGPKGAPTAPEAGRFPNEPNKKTNAQLFAETIDAMLGNR